MNLLLIKSTGKHKGKREGRAQVSGLRLSIGLGLGLRVRVNE